MGTDPIPNANLLDPPSPRQQVQFKDGFGQRAVLTVDTEEEFDWQRDFSRQGHTLEHLPRLAKFQQFCGTIGVKPIYLLDWPVAQSDIAQDIIGSAVAAGEAEIGVQLHPWVNPPHDEDVNRRSSFPGNLPPALERDKFRRLRDLLEDKFGAVPRIYRAGRYGLGPATATILSETGIAIDTSVRACFDYSAEGGPDYRRHPTWPYWSDAGRSLIELPLTTVYWGMLRRQGESLFPAIQRAPRLAGLCTRLGLLERIALTPEGVSPEEALKAVDIALDDGLPILNISFHSPSLSPGHTPYVRTEDDLDDFYDWLRAVFGYLDRRGVRPATVAQIIDAAIV